MNKNLNEVRKYKKIVKNQTKRYDLINYLIEQFGYQSYLEIGVRNQADCFDRVKCGYKESIDPNPRSGTVVTYRMTSDEAFALIHQKEQTYDIIFIDGLHLEEQVDRDIVNSLQALNENGTLVMHDCNPPNKFMQREKFEVNGKFPPWNGTVWKSYVKLRFREDLEVRVVDTDWGCGIVRRGKQQVYAENFLPTVHLTYQFLDWDRKNLLNLISVEEFYQKFKN